MISLSVDKKCDKIILVSGDYDYPEAFRYVKNNMTKIHIVKFHTGYPPKSRNMSRDLSVLADKVLDVYESDLRAKFVKSVYILKKVKQSGKRDSSCYSFELASRVCPKILH